MYIGVPQRQVVPSFKETMHETRKHHVGGNAWVVIPVVTPVKTGAVSRQLLSLAQWVDTTSSFRKPRCGYPESSRCLNAGWIPGRGSCRPLPGMTSDVFSNSASLDNTGPWPPCCSTGQASPG